MQVFIHFLNETDGIKKTYKAVGIFGLFSSLLFLSLAIINLLDLFQGLPVGFIALTTVNIIIQNPILLWIISRNESLKQYILAQVPTITLTLVPNSAVHPDTANA
jgi:hypothetical protein